MTAFEYNFEVPQSNCEWDCYKPSTYSPLSPWFEESIYNEPCPICFSHSHLVTECYRAHEFLEFIQKYVYATQGCMNSSSDNSYLYTHNNEWEPYANSSWTQEPWVDDANTSYRPSHYIASPEQSDQHDYLSLLQENPNFEDSMWQKLANLEIQMDRLVMWQKLADLEIQLERLEHNGQEEHESLTQGKQELVWEEDTHYEKDNGEVCEA
ncbi:hypothetical protein Acr_00g0078060 [Actinidia rufa]|uniref:Uncharacterized protein n=1 Tax=Actinidia rufa TaxID=165716 RepID=A0A7J0DTT5_9ERIC|nr:hypothetical protein Acr_00g0078060 [Actinidia rufa]